MTGRIGIEFNGYSVTVEHLPYRKKPCLVVMPKGENCAYKVASFNSEETADWFLTQMSRMFGQTERSSE
jgi:hypothetical protein